MIYLDNSATSDNKPKKVIKAVTDALKTPVNVGRNSSKSAFDTGKKVYAVREKIADLINVDNPANIIFTNNASMALNFAFKGVVKENSNIITTMFEHNSVLRQIYADRSLTCSFLPADENYVTDIEYIPKLIKDNTSLIAINCASNVTGVTVDYKRIYEICKEFHIPILFDFSQYIGNYKVDISDMENVIAAFSGHKSLLGPQGIGVMYVSDNTELATIFEGGTGSLSENLDQPDYLPDRFEVGTANTPGILGLGAGVDFVTKSGQSEMLEHKLFLCKRLYDGLKNIRNVEIHHDGNFKNKIPLISFNVKDNFSEKIATLLSSQYNISVRGGYHCAPYAHNYIGTKNMGAVRMSPGYKTTKREIDKAIYAVSKISKKMLFSI